ncbi:MAG: signal peptidase I [Pseudomonadota bacterium]
MGYVYVGRIKLAVVYAVGVVGLVAAAGWLGLVFEPIALYGLAVVALCLSLFVVIHCAVIAARNENAEFRPYNVWWFYLLWMVGSWCVVEGGIWSRSVLFGYEPFSVPSASMAPTVDRGDYIMTDTWYYDHSDPMFGDLVVFTVPGGSGTKYVKRVIGLPGDQIEIRDDVLVRNGQEISEPYIQVTSRSAGAGSNFGPETVPSASFFVLGDNRHNSRDSRYIGAIDRSLLHGRVIHRWFAFNESIRWDRFPERFEN